MRLLTGLLSFALVLGCSSPEDAAVASGDAFTDDSGGTFEFPDTEPFGDGTPSAGADLGDEEPGDDVTAEDDAVDGPDISGDTGPGAEDVETPPVDVTDAPELPASPDTQDAADATVAECGDCDDALWCTVDGCDDAGECTHVPTPGTCYIDGECFYSATTKSPCEKCVPTKDPLSWTSLDGGPCEDGNPCTLADICDDGVCIGVMPNPCTPPGPCTESVGCDVKTGECQFVAKPDGVSCGPGSVCFAEACVPGDGLPTGTVAWFDRDACPGGWSLYAQALGRTVTPAGQLAPGTTFGAALSSGEEPVHTHSVSVDVSTSSVSYVGIGGCCNGGTTPQTTVNVSGTAEPASTGLPYVQLLPCQKTDGQVVGTVPAELTWATSDAACPGDASPWTLAADRYLVGTPEGGTAVATFGGGDGLTSPHAHSVSGVIPTPAKGIALASGCCAGGYAGSNGLSVNTTTSAETPVFPGVALALCAAAPSVVPDAAPAGIVLFSQTESCPPGWSIFLGAAGRLIVGTAAAGDVGLEVGDALGDKEDRTHTHAVSVSATLPSRTISAADGGNNQGAQNGVVSATFTSGAATSGARFMQLTACRRDE
jgi:hypothetical protein